MFPTNVACSTEPPLKATADKSIVSGTGEGFSACGIPSSTDTVTVTASGGRAPYTYAWNRQGAAAQYGPWVCGSPSSNATKWSAPGSVCDPASPSIETWRCTVTDAIGREEIVDVDVQIIWNNIS